MLAEQWDKVIKYIDLKVGDSQESLKSLFDDYSLKTIANNLGDIKKFTGKWLGASATAPTEKSNGSMYYDEHDDVLKFYTESNNKWNSMRFEQQVDGGRSDSVYTTTQTIDGGGA